MDWKCNLKQTLEALVAILRDGLKEVPSNNLAALCQFS